MILQQIRWFLAQPFFIVAAAFKDGGKADAEEWFPGSYYDQVHTLKVAFGEVWYQIGLSLYNPATNE